MPRVTLSRDFLRGVMQSEPVRARLAEVARDVAADYRDAARDEDYYQTDGAPTPDDPRVTTGTRPGGRPYARVSVPATDEWGDYKRPKRRALGRAAARHSSPRGRR